MTGRLFQGIILQMKDITDRIIGIMDSAGVVVACTELSMIGSEREDETLDLNSGSGVTIHSGYVYQALPASGAHYEFAVFVEGEDKTAEMLCAMAAIALGSVRTMYNEKHDKATFIKNIILDNILPGDIYIKSTELHFGSDVPRVVFLISFADATDTSAIDVVSSLFPDKQRDFVIGINEKDLVLVKEVKPNVELKDLMKIAHSIEDTINTELMMKSTIGIGTVAMQLKDIVSSFKEAQLAIEVGQVFDTEKSILNKKLLLHLAEIAVVVFPGEGNILSEPVRCAESIGTCFIRKFYFSKDEWSKISFEKIKLDRQNIG